MKPAPRLLRLSPYVRPEVSIGERILTPQNISDGSDRLRYLEGAQDFIQRYLRWRKKAARKPDWEAEIAFLRSFPFVKDLISIERRGGRFEVNPRRGVIDDLAFNPDRVTLIFLDGRNRDWKGSLRFPVGKAMPEAARLLSALTYGIPEDRVGKLSGLQRRLFRELKRRGLLDTVARDELVSSPSWDSPGDRLTWLGHAAVIFQSGPSTLWVDPWLAPKVKWTPRDLKELFSEKFADRYFFDPYDSSTQPYSVSELPKPEAVLITHQDCDHFDLGTLALLPESTPIVVPKASEGRPWDVDLARVCRQVLGARRRIIRLGHGESLSIGAVRVTALPFEEEMPASLPHQWNCYLLQTRSTAVALAADSSLGERIIGALKRELGAKRKPLTICCRELGKAVTVPGYHEEWGYFLNRLWPWYQRPIDVFSSREGQIASYQAIRRLARSVNLSRVCIYAVGSTPWQRIDDPADALMTRVSSLSAGLYDRSRRGLRRMRLGLDLLVPRYGRPFRLDR